MTQNNNASKQWMFWVFYCVVFVALPLFGLNYTAKIIVKKKSLEKQYLLSGERINGDLFFVICHENPTNDHYDLMLNREMQFYKQLMVSGEPINTTNPVFCQSYGKAFVEPENRVKEIPPKTAGEKRLAFIGDSITFGEGVRTGEAFPEKMQTYLDFYDSRDSWRILNFGRMGYDIPEIYSKCFKSALKAKPDRIVYVWFPNDMPRGKWGFPEILQQNDMINNLNFYSRHANTNPMLLILRAKMVERTATRETVRWIKNINGPANPEGIRRFREYLRKMKKESGDIGADFSVVLFPIIAGGPGKYPFASEHAYVKKVIAEEKIPVIDITDDVISLPVKKLIVHPRNHHPNHLAHGFAARALIKDLKLSATDLFSTPTIKETYKPIWRVPSDIYEQGGKSPESLYAFYFLLIFAFLYLIAVVLNGRTLARALWSENNRVNLMFLLILAFTVAVRLWLAPRTHLVFNDEHCRLKLIEMWMNGYYYANTLNNTPGPIMYDFVFYKLLGLTIATGWISAMSAVIASFVLLYATIRLLWKNDLLALLCCMFYATFPVTIRFSLAQTAENPNMLMQISVFFAIVANLRKNDLPSLFLLVVSSALLAFMRLYNGAFALFMLFCWVYAKSIDEQEDTVFGLKTILTFISSAFRGLRRPKYIVSLVVTLGVFAFYTWFVIASINESPYGDHVKNLSQSMTSNFASNLLFLFSNAGIPIVTILLVFLGMAAFFIKAVSLDRKKQMIFLLSGWIMVCFLLHVASVAGGYDFRRYFDTVRYTTDFLLPIIVLASLGVYTATASVSQQRFWVGVALISAYMLFFPIKYTHVIHYETHYTEASKDITEEIGDYPKNTVFYTNAFFLKNTIEMDFHRPAKLVSKRSDIPAWCPRGKRCVLVIHQMFESSTENDPSPYRKCFSRHLYKDGSLSFCPLKSTKDLFNNELVQQVSGACFF